MEMKRKIESKLMFIFFERQIIGKLDYFKKYPHANTYFSEALDDKSSKTSDLNQVLKLEPCSDGEILTIFSKTAVEELRSISMIELEIKNRKIVSIRNGFVKYNEGELVPELILREHPDLNKWYVLDIVNGTLNELVNS